MQLTREQELKLFRNVNGVNSKWKDKNNRISFIDSNRQVHLRQNQGKVKAKFIKKFITELGRNEILKGVVEDVNQDK